MSNALKSAAQAGDIKALEGLMNQSFQAKGITVRVTNSGRTLKVLIRSSQVPDRQYSTLIRQGIQNIMPQNFDQVCVSARAINGDVSWTDQWRLDNLDTQSVAKAFEYESVDIPAVVEEQIPISGQSIHPDVSQRSLSWESENHQNTRKAYQFLQIRVQLIGRGMTNEIMNIYVNGKRIKPKVSTCYEFLNYLGSQGFRVVVAELETEGIYTHFYTLEREVFTHQIPSEDIYTTLEKTKEGADFGDSIRNFLEFGLFDNF
jgi:hypothetical protein